MLKNQKGISIIEILMALLISTIVTTAVITLFSNSLDTSRQLMGTAKLDQTLNHAMETIAQDIQRAGYTTNATTSATNPFFSTNAGSNDDVIVGGSSDCVTFSYQIDGTTTPTTSVNRFGYRLSGGAIQYRTSAAGATPCAAAGWENLTDPNIITISAFTVTLNTTNLNPSTGATTTTSPYTGYRSVTIAITGNLVSNTAVTRTITRTIKIFNNKYTP